MRRIGIVALLLAGTVASTAQAQGRGRSAPTAPLDERVRIVINGGGIFNTQTLEQQFTLRKNVEATPVSTELDPAAGGFVEVGGRIRIAPAVWVGATVFAMSASLSGTLDAQVPHPFYFGQPRDVSGEIDQLSGTSKGVHVEAAFAVSSSDRREILLFGGPSYFRVKQDLVTDFTYSDAYPYDTAEFESTVTAQATDEGFGFNVGAEATWRLARSVRAGAMLRYSLANLTLPVAPGNEADMRAGGLQVGGSVQLLFGR